MDKWFAVYSTETGQCVSTGTVVADPLPPHLAARELTQEEYGYLVQGGVWDAVSLTVTPPAPKVPQTVTAWQIRRWLIANGYSLSQVSAVIDAIPDAAERDAVLVDWEYAPYVDRNHPMLEPLAAALGIEDLDAAFIAAERII